MALTFDNGIGVNQTWQDVTGSRALGTTYTNTTGKPIKFIASTSYALGGNFTTATVNGLAMAGMLSAASNEKSFSLALIVPVGGTYSAVASQGLLFKWYELR